MKGEKTIKNCMKFLKDKYNSRKEIMIKKNIFADLIPYDNVDLGLYSDAFDYIFENKKIRNIAISGAYGAGKSSIIETYKKKNPKMNILHISLAYFVDNKESFDNDDENNQETNNFTNNMLEGKIINQLIHQIKPSKIPQTNFKVKRKITKKHLSLISLISILFLLITLYLFSINTWINYVNSLKKSWYKSLFEILIKEESFLVLAIIWGITICIAIFNILKYEKNKRIFNNAKIKNQSLEIEIFENNSESYFDKHLNEVLYLFENSEADAIIFEDMDRFNSNKIFERLREINLLINNRCINGKSLKFMYLLRDDIFTSKDRTKFFDFIIPVVPVVDSTNSFDKFIIHFKNIDIIDRFDMKFLQELSLYIDDLRLLKNIYNEYLFYYDKIEKIKPDNNKLLAIITYKNLFPRDYADLQLNKGFVFNLFKSKPNIIEDEINEINNKISEINEEIKKIKENFIDDIDIFNDVFDKQIRAIGNYNHVEREKLEQFKEKINKNYNNNKIDSMRTCNNKIKNFENEKSMLKNATLMKILYKKNIDKIFKEINFIDQLEHENGFEEVRKNHYFDLLKFLIKRGYIDETFSDYMTYFYEENLSRSDKIFWRSITDQKAEPADYKLEKPGIIIDKLRHTDFEQEEIFNYDLLTYLLKNDTSPLIKEYLERFMKQLKSTNNYNFISEFFDKNQEVEKLIQHLANYWISFSINLINKSWFNQDQLKKFILDSIYFLSDEQINEINIDNQLTEYISNDKHFLDIKKPIMHKILNAFSLLSVSFKEIDSENINSELFYKVYSNSFYDLNSNNIFLMLKHFYKISDSENYFHKNYFLVMTKPEKPLAKYINNNINEYLTLYLDFCKKNIQDPENIIIDILNNENIENDLKENYLKYSTTIITDITTIFDKNLWSILLKNNVILYNENNILNYYFSNENKLDNNLIQFINSKEEKLSININENIYGKGSESSFFRSIVKCNKLNDENYLMLLKQINRYYPEFSIDNIDFNKIKILINIGKIEMNSYNLVFIREHYPGNLLYYIKHNISNYINKILTRNNFIFDEMLDVIDLRIDDKYKIDLIRLTTESITIIDKNYSDELNEYILQNNLCEDDLNILFEQYKNFGTKTKKQIFELSCKFIEKIIAEKIKIPFFSKLISSEKISINQKKEIFILILNELDKEKCKKYLEIIGLHEFLSLFNLGRPKIEITDINKRILEIFLNNKWITKYEIENDDNYRVFGRKQKKIINKL